MKNLNKKISVFIFLILGLSQSLQASTNTTFTLNLPNISIVNAGRCQKNVLKNTVMTVQYSISAVNTAMNNSICGSSIPIGTAIDLKFNEHKYQDLCWVGTGGVIDSPCGDWSLNAERPVNVCTEQFTTTGKNRTRVDDSGRYVAWAFMANPPKKVLENLNGLDCNKISTYHYKCTVTAAGSYNLEFLFNETQIKVHYGSKNRESDLSCTSNAEGRTTYMDNNCKTPWVMNIPEKKLQCAFTATQNQTTINTLAPTITTRSCHQGQANITISSANTKKVKFGIDWNNDGTVDEYTSFVNQSQSINVDHGFVFSNNIISVISVDENGNFSPKTQHIITCNNICPNGATNPSACNICPSGKVMLNNICVDNICPSGQPIQLVNGVYSCPTQACSVTNACGQTIQGTTQNGQCIFPTQYQGNNSYGYSNINSSCIQTFSITSSSINPNGSTQFSWNIPNTPNIGRRCGFVDLSKGTTPVPIQGLQNLDPGIDKVRITNIQRSTNFCLVCKFYDLATNQSRGEAAAHNWVRVIRVGDN